MDARVIARVWRWYKRRPSKCLREILVGQYDKIVTDEAMRLRRKLPASVSLEELLSDGAMGLLDAIERFDPQKKIKFQTFAPLRIRGAMMDGLRERDPVSRTTRLMIRKREEVGDAIRSTHGVEPSAQELAGRMGVGMNRLAAKEREARAANMRSLSGGRIKADEGGRDVALDHVPSKAIEDPARGVMRGLVRAWVTEGLSREEKLIILLYYYEDMSMKEIGLVLGLSESRVSQMHSELLKRLRCKVTAPELLV